jgi:hypothetical protein
MRSIFLTLALVASASAHTIFQQLYVNGVSPGHQVGIRVPTYDGVRLSQQHFELDGNTVVCSQSWTLLQMTSSAMAASTRMRCPSRIA